MDIEPESRDDVLSRHRKELRELENKARFMLKQAKKAKKAEVEAEVSRHISLAFLAAITHLTYIDQIAGGGNQSEA